MGNCNMDCCKSIDKRETQFIQLSSKSNNFNPKKFNQIRPIEYSQIEFSSKDNIENKNEENKMIYGNEKKKIKKYNENTNSDTNYKDITIKYSKKLVNDRFYSPNNRYDKNCQLLKSKTNENKNNNNNSLKIDNKDNNDYNKEEDIEINEKKSPIITPRYITNYKTAKSTYSKYFEHIEECRQKLEMTDKGKNRPNNISNIFPIKYNKKKKYITFFTEDDL